MAQPLMNVSILALLAGESHLDNGPIYVYSTHCQQQSTAMHGPKLTQTEQPVGLEQVEGADSADTADSVDLLRKRGGHMQTKCRLRWLNGLDD